MNATITEKSSKKQDFKGFSATQYTTKTQQKQYSKADNPLKPTSGRNPCGICGDTSGDCRISQNEEVILCKDNAFADVGEIINGYRMKELNHGRWGLFSLVKKRKPITEKDVAETKKLAQIWQNLRRSPLNEVQSLDLQANQNSNRTASNQPLEDLTDDDELDDDGYMPVEERHPRNKEILGDLRVDSQLIDFLTKRGFTTDQIERSGFKSVDKYQKLARRFPWNLPGIADDGKSLVNRDKGFLIPVFDYEQNIVAFQTRFYNQESRYSWCKIPSSQPNGQIHKIKVNGNLETPLTVRKTKKPEKIILAEGLGAKPFLISERFNAVCIGASGGQFRDSHESLHTYLVRAWEDYQQLRKQPIYIALDAGAVHNRQIMTQWNNVRLFLEEQGYYVLYMWWGQESKDDKDLDELEPEKFEEIEYYSTEEFYNLHSDKSLFISEKIVSTTRLEKWIKDNQFTPTEGYSLPDSRIVIPPQKNHGEQLLIKAGMGLGKTESCLNYIGELNKQGISSITIVPLKTLRNNTIGRGKNKGLTLTKIGTDDKDEQVSIFDTDSQDDLVVEVNKLTATKHYVLCAESLHKIQDELHESVLICDEPMQVFPQLLSGGTVSGSRQALTLEFLKSAIKKCPRCIFLDANLNDRFASFIEEIKGDSEKVIKILYTYQNPKNDVYFMEHLEAESEESDKTGKRKRKKSEKSGHIKEIIETEQKSFLVSDSRESLKQINLLARAAGKRLISIHRDVATQSYEEWFKEDPKIAETDFAKQIIAIGGVKNNWVQDFMLAPDKFIQSIKPDILSGSPSLATGVSIETNNYFDRIDVLLYGVVTSRTATQMPKRLRDATIPIYLSCPLSSSKGKDYLYGSTNEFSLVNAWQKRYDALVKLGKEPSVDDMASVLKAAKDRSNIAFENFKAYLDVEEQFELENYKACLIQRFIWQGHTIKQRELDTDDETKEDIKKTKEFLNSQEASNIFIHEPYETLSEALEVKKGNPTKTQRYRISKTELLERLPEIHKSNLWNDEFTFTRFIKDFWVEKKDIIYKLELRQYVENLDYCRQKFEDKAFKQCAEQFVFSPSIVKTVYLKAEAIKKLGVLDIIKWLEQGEAIHHKSPQVEFLFKTLKASKKIQRDLNERIPKERLDNSHIMRFVSKLLESLGVHIKSDAKILIDGVRTATYKLVPGCVNRQLAEKVINEALALKMKTWIENFTRPNWAMEAQRDLQLERAKGHLAFSEVPIDEFIIPNKVEFNSKNKQVESDSIPKKTDDQIWIDKITELTEKPRQNETEIISAWNSLKNYITKNYSWYFSIKSLKVLENLGLYCPLNDEEEDCDDF